MKDKNSKLSTEAYRGVRDFFPADMFIQNYIFSTLKKIVEGYGYLEYNASVLEPADLYKQKSGDEIVNEQTYTFKDRGDREVTLRPEMTPTLARMISAKRRELPLPIRWYSIPNLFRYENPQRGRVREHWQLNVDIFGVKTIEAETEVISVASDIMHAFGLKDTDFEIRLNSRKVINFILNEAFGLNADEAYRVAKLIDRKNKMPAEEFTAEINKIMPDAGNDFLTIINSKNFSDLTENLKGGEALKPVLAEISDLLGNLEKLGITNVIFDQTIMRGFDYYTGIVFEVYDKNPQNKRAVFGGGRYDDLLDIFGSEKIHAVGFGMGDVVLRDLMETYGTLPAYDSGIRVAICLADKSALDFARDLAQKIREAGLKVILDLTDKKLGDQIKAADKAGVPNVICLGQNEVETGKFKIKKLSTGLETEVDEATLVKNLK